MDIQNNGKANAHYREIKEGLLDYPPPTNALTIQKSAMCRYMKKRNVIQMNILVTRLMYLNNYLSFFPGSDTKDFETRGLHLLYLPMFLQVLKRFG